MSFRHPQGSPPRRPRRTRRSRHSLTPSSSDLAARRTGRSPGFEAPCAATGRLTAGGRQPVVLEALNTHIQQVRAGLVSGPKSSLSPDHFRNRTAQSAEAPAPLRITNERAAALAKVGTTAQSRPVSPRLSPLSV